MNMANKFFSCRLDCIHVGSVVYGLWERKGDSLNYYVVYITQLNATHVDFVLDYTHGNGILLTRSYNRSEPVLVVDEIPKMIDILVGSRVIGVHKRAHKEWYQAGTVIRTTPRYAYVRFGSGTDRWVPPRELRLQRRPRFCATGAWGRHNIDSTIKWVISRSVAVFKSEVNTLFLACFCWKL